MASDNMTVPEMREYFQAVLAFPRWKGSKALAALDALIESEKSAWEMLEELKASQQTPLDALVASLDDATAEAEAAELLSHGVGVC